MAAAHLEVLEVLGHQGVDADRDVEEEVQGVIDELVGDGPICVGKVQPHHMQVGPLFLLSGSAPILLLSVPHTLGIQASLPSGSWCQCTNYS